MRGAIFPVLALLAGSSPVRAQQVRAAPPAALPASSIVIDPDGTAHLDHATVPPSSLLSPATRAVLARRPAAGAYPSSPPAADMAVRRRQIEADLQPAIAHMRKLYPVDIAEGTMGGISIRSVIPQGGVPARNLRRVILDVPGGGFRTATHANGLTISIPIAAVGQVKVVTLIHRQGPEYRFPAGTEDVAAVYRELLKTYPPANIGMVGCSSGGAVVAETVAYFERVGLPAPGVLGLYCARASAKFKEGDGPAFTNLLRSTVNIGENPSTYAYFEGMDPDDPKLSPVMDLTVLARFPPTLFATGTRDFAMSAAAYSHRRMLDAGVDSQLLVYDGMGHAFMTDPDLPESKSLYAIAAKFYDAHLGR